MTLSKEAKELKAQVDQSETNIHGRIYTDELKQAVVNYHYKSGKTFTVISKEIGVHLASISMWKKKFGRERTAFVFGNSVRNDVRTKALCVQEYKETKTTQVELGKKYNVSVGTVNKWIADFSDNYEELLDTRDGVPYLVKEKKMVFGDKNIELVLELKEKYVTELSHIIEIMHDTGLTPGKTLTKEIEAKKKKTNKEIQTLKEADKILKENKK